MRWRWARPHCTWLGSLLLTVAGIRTASWLLLR
jgi:hypothetical protein